MSTTRRRTYVVKPTADRKYVKALLRELPSGYKIGIIWDVRDSGEGQSRPVSAKHPAVLTPSGDVLRLNGVPVLVCGTTSKPRALKNDLRNIRHAIAGTQEAG